jgi:class 3 adenylate cyclase
MRVRKNIAVSLIGVSALALFLVAFSFVACRVKSLQAMPKASGGRLDLSSWSFGDRETLPLDGEWEFFPGELISPGAPKATGYVNLPDSGLWKNAYGCASYRLTIAFPERHGTLLVKVPTIFSASRIVLNGREIYSAGTVGTTRETAKSWYRPDILTIDPSAGENELVVQVANFAERRGGVNKSLIIGAERPIKTMYVGNLAMDLIVFGSLLTIGLYHLCLFWLRKKDRSPLWFGVFCLIIAVRSLIYGERFIFGLFPGIPWEVFNRIDHLTFYIGIPVYGSYLIAIFSRDMSLVAMRVYQALGLLFALFLFFPPAVFNVTVSVYEIITVGYIAYFLLVIARSLARRREGSLTTMVGVVLFLCFGINEILFNMGIVNTFNSLSIGLVLFLFTQSILIAMRFSKAFDQSERLGQTLLSTNEALRRFIPGEFFTLLNRKGVNDIRLGDQIQQDMTIMFSDIRSFTSLAERLGAAKTFEFLNDYFGRVGEVIRDNGGFVDKYLGDGFIALFPSSPESALKAAVGMQRVIADFNASRTDANIPSIEVGIGLNYGPLILGTVGEERRMDTTVIADSVNLCSRLESLSKSYGKGTIVPVDFFARIGDAEAYHWRRLGLIHVKGRRAAVEIAHVYDGLPESDFAMFESTKARFEAALYAFRNGGYGTAQSELGILARETPNDPAIFTFLKEIDQIIATNLANACDEADEAGEADK